jgi:hypothetical protein
LRLEFENLAQELVHYKSKGGEPAPELPQLQNQAQMLDTFGAEIVISPKKGA